MVIGLVRAASLRRGTGDSPAVESMRLKAEGSPAVDSLPDEPPRPDGMFGRPHVVAVPASEPEKPDTPGPTEPVDAYHPLWMGAFEEELARAERTGAQLSLLLAELEDADRLAAAEASDDASATFGRFAQALREAVRRQDILACETDARAWVIARDTGRAGAQALAGRIASSVRGARPWRGAPMRVTVGVAVVGEDGHDAATLVEVAEEARFTAAASGIEVVPAGRPPESE
jgi:GGDEF domain-containing protein